MRSSALLRASIVLALTLTIAPWATAQQRGDRTVPTTATATFLGLPSSDSFLAPTPMSESFGADLLNETFDGATFPATGWTLLASGSSSTYPDWRRETGLGCSTANPCAAAYYQGPLQDRYLVTPQITPTTGGSTLTFRSAQPWSNFASEYHVMVSTTTPAVGEFADVAVYDQTNLPTGGANMSAFSVDLSAYVGTPIYIAFMHRQNDGNLWLLDDVRIAQNTPASFGGAGLAYQNKGVVAPGARMWAVAANVFVSGDVGTVTANRLTFNTAGTTDVADLALAQLYYTGASTTLSYGTTPQFDSGVASPNGTMTFLGSQALAPGNNHFVLVYYVAGGAQPGHRLDATFEGAMIGGEDRTPAVRTLTGALSVARFNDALADARVVDAATYIDQQSNENATSETGEIGASCGFGGAPNDGNRSIWYAYTPTTSGSMTFATGGNFDALLTAYTGTAHPLTQIACADGSYNGSNPESLTVAVSAGTTYYLRVSGITYDPVGTVNVSVTGPAPAFGAFAFEQPTMGQEFRAGGWLKAAWDSPSAPVAAAINLYLRDSGGAETLIYTGANLEYPDFGAARYQLPTTTPAGTYTLRIEDAAAPSRTATSALFTIADPDGRFVFTNPVGGETFCAGVGTSCQQTITWTSPANAGSGSVTLEFRDKATNEILQSVTTENDGSYTGGLYIARQYITITSDDFPAYSGRSRSFRADMVGALRVTGGPSFATGSVLPARWGADALLDQNVDVTLWHPVHGTRRIATGINSTEYGYDYTLPADLVADDGYAVKVRYFSFLTGQFRNLRSATFSITGGVERPAATPHFATAPTWGTDSATLRLAAPGLADGTEIGAFMDGRLVGAGVVAGGTAEVTVEGSLLVPALVADGRPMADDFVYLADGTALTLRAFASSAETEIETETAVVYVGGSETAVVAKGAAGIAPVAEEAPTALAVDTYPNPASTRATVRFASPSAAPATVTVYDLLGRAIATPFSGEAQAGTNEVAVATSALPAGVYIVRVTAGAETATTRLTVIR